MHVHARARPGRAFSFTAWVVRRFRLLVDLNGWVIDDHVAIHWSLFFEKSCARPCMARMALATARATAARGRARSTSYILR